MGRRLLRAALVAVAAVCLAVPAYADDTGPLTPPGVSGPGEVVGDGARFDPPSGPVVTLTPDPTTLPDSGTGSPRDPSPGSGPGATAPSVAPPAVPGSASTPTGTPSPASVPSAGTGSPPSGTTAMVGPDTVLTPAQKQPVWDMRDALPWWLLATSTALALAGLGTVWFRRRSSVSSSHPPADR